MRREMTDTAPKDEKAAEKSEAQISNEIIDAFARCLLPIMRTHFEMEGECREHNIIQHIPS